MKKLKPVLTVVSALSIFLGIIAAIWIVVAAGEVPAEMKNAHEIMRTYPSLSNGISLGLYESLILLIIAGAACLLAWVINTSTNPQTGKSIFIGVVALGVLTLICVFGFGNGSFDPAWTDEGSSLTSTSVQWISGGIFLTGALILIGILSIVYLEISKIFK